MFKNTYNAKKNQFMDKGAYIVAQIATNRPLWLHLLLLFTLMVRIWSQHLYGSESIFQNNLLSRFSQHMCFKEKQDQL